MLDKVIKEHLIDCMTEEKKIVELQEDDRSKIDIKVMQQMIITLSIPEILYNASIGIYSYNTRF